MCVLSACTCVVSVCTVCAFAFACTSVLVQEPKQVCVLVFCAFTHSVFLSPHSSDAVYVLAFAVIMLNTDLHNPQVKKKMSRTDFLKNNRGINEGENLPDDFLEDLYERYECSAF